MWKLALVLAAIGGALIAMPASPERVVKRFARAEGMSGAILVTGRGDDDDDAPRIVAFGTGAGGRPLTPETVLPLASLSKPVTAAVVLRLVRSGRLSLDDRLADLVPEVAGAGDARYREITVRHLLTHTAGLRWMPSPAGLFGPDVHCRDAALALVDDPLLAPPGEVQAYSNLGYCWLGIVIERVAGQRYEEEAADAGFDLAMTSPALWAAGGWSGRASAIFEALGGEIPPEALSRPLGAFGESYYGLGWHVAEGYLWHHGVFVGTSFAVAVRMPDGRNAVALFAGSPGNPRQDASVLAGKLAASLRRRGWLGL